MRGYDEQISYRMLFVRAIARRPSDIAPSETRKQDLDIHLFA